MLEDNQQNPKKNGQGKKKIAAIAAAVLVIALTIGLAGALLMNAQNPSNTQTDNQKQPDQSSKQSTILD